MALYYIRLKKNYSYLSYSPVLCHAPDVAPYPTWPMHSPNAIPSLPCPSAHLQKPLPLPHMIHAVPPMPFPPPPLCLGYCF